MKNKLSLLGGLSLVVMASLLLTACASAVQGNSGVKDTKPAAVATAVPTAAAPTAVPLVLNVSENAALGKFLVDGKGMTLYIFTKDEPGKSNCSGGCLQVWPPLLADVLPTAGDGVDTSKISHVEMADGGKIVAYNNMPLYYYAEDTKPGDVLGQDVGKVWFVIDPAGNIVKPQPAATPTASSGAVDDKGYGDEPPAASSAEPTINVADDPNLGKYLVDGKGMTLYIFTKDEPGKSNCSGGCLKAWPPLLTLGHPVLGAGVDSAKVGAAKLADGTLIVTYDQKPLYYYANDSKPGDITGQNVNYVWFIITP